MEPENQTAPEVEIRKMEPEEAAGIERVAQDIWRTVYPGLITPEQIDYMLGWMYAPDKLAREMVSEGVTYLGLFLDGEMVGFSAVGPEGGEEGGTSAADFSGKGTGAFLHKLYLHPAWHGKGLGSRLMKKTEALALEKGWKHIRLRVNRNNESAIRVYERNGYRKLEEVCSDIGGGFVMDDWVMGKALG